ncbi:MAG TPA: class IV adenylate cyclase [Isosphaeraceae bacterium]|jgi:adenylate cyclase class 2|nr:class IV adenylate cyclase [Isosphaeraceae bacterium]
MSIEIEVKFRVANLEPLRAQLRASGAAPGAMSTQIDTYLSHPDRDFAETDEALRIRSGSVANFLTYKGPKWGGPTKTREEVEIAFEAGPEPSGRLALLFDRLGFKTIAVIAKNRTQFHVDASGRALQVALDEARDLGAFVEVETLAENEADVAAAQEAVLKLAQQLGLSEVEPRSYLRMALERLGR